MKKKMFSLFLMVTLFLTSLNPIFARGSEINVNDENSTKVEDLQTNLINNVQNYGTIINENNEKVAFCKCDQYIWSNKWKYREWQKK